MLSLITLGIAHCFQSYCNMIVKALKLIGVGSLIVYRLILYGLLKCVINIKIMWLNILRREEKSLNKVKKFYIFIFMKRTPLNEYNFKMLPF